MGVSSISAAPSPACQVSQAAQAPQAAQTAAPQAAGVSAEQRDLVELMREEREKQPSLAEMMQEAREKAEEQAERFKLPKNSRRYGDAALTAYSKLARARTMGDVDAASGYARRQIAQFQSAKHSDSDNAQRIEAAIRQLRKAVNRAGRKKRELSREKLTAARQKRLMKEKRLREARRLRHQLKGQQAQRMIRESGYLREAEVDNRTQDQLAASRLELRQQMQQLNDQFGASLESAIAQYAAAEAAPPAEPAISVEA